VIFVNNPYSISKPASDAGYFIAIQGGRSSQARRLFRNISRSRPLPDSISLVGERRFGKTSLLEYLRQSASGIPNLQVVDVDMSSLKPLDQNGFYAMLTQNLIEENILPLDHPLLTYQSFRTTLARFEKTGQRLLLFIDEFDRVAQERRFDRSFFDNLRSAAMRFPLAFVIASVMPLAKVAYEEVHGSPFFNFFQEERLEQLCPQEVDALISHPPCGELGVCEYAKEVVALAGNHPYFLQLACGCAWDLREESGDTSSDAPDITMTRLRRSFTRKAHRQYDYIWHHCNIDEQRTLCNLASGIQCDEAQLSSLIERGYVIDRTPLRICGEGLSEFVKGRCTAPSLDRTSDRTYSQRESEDFKPISLAEKEHKHFDVFLCHNGEDKQAVRNLAIKLLEQEIQPWLSEWELRPGLPWQPLLEEQILIIKAVAVFVGQKGICPWQKQEIGAFLREFVNRGCPVIPVLLPDAPKEPQLPIFLSGMTWVDFRMLQPDPMERLIWGITGERDIHR